MDTTWPESPADRRARKERIMNAREHAEADRARRAQLDRHAPVVKVSHEHKTEAARH